MNLWLFIGRLNPPHIGHIRIIEKSLHDNKQTLVLLWTPLQKDEKNPYSFLERKDMLHAFFGNQKKLTIMEVHDLASDLSWVLSIYKTICEYFPRVKNIYFYGGDFQNDTAYRAIKKYKDYFFRYDIHFLEQSRQDNFIQIDSQKVEVSSSNLREAIKEQNYKLAQKLTKQEIFEKIKR